MWTLPYKVLKPACKHSFTQNFCTCRLMSLWNVLTEYIACASTVNVFKQLLKYFDTKSFCKSRAFRTC